MPSFLSARSFVQDQNVFYFNDRLAAFLAPALPQQELSELTLVMDDEPEPFSAKR